jgi:hypothetical protein
MGRLCILLRLHSLIHISVYSFYVFSRETVKANVFGMGIAPPTVSLAEFGDMQKQEAEERAAREAAAPPGTRKCVNL